MKYTTDANQSYTATDRRPDANGSGAARHPDPSAEACPPGSSQGGNTNTCDATGRVQFVFIDIGASEDRQNLGRAFVEAGRRLDVLAEASALATGSYRDVGEAATWFGIARRTLQYLCKGNHNLGGDHVLGMPFKQIGGGPQRPRFVVWIPDRPRDDHKVTLGMEGGAIEIDKSWFHLR